MTFHSILFKTTEGINKEELLMLKAPDCFVDLNLNQIVDAITSGKEEYNLKPFFYTSLSSLDEIKFRHEIMQDLENEILFEYVESFAKNMRTVHNNLEQADKISYKYQKERLFLDVVKTYCQTLNTLLNNLSKINLKSRGFLAFKNYLTNYLNSSQFKSLFAETKKMISDLSSIRYCVLLKDLSIQVRNYQSETDYSKEVEKTFDRFKQGEVKDYRVTFPLSNYMNTVEEKIMDGVAQLNSDIFLHLDTFYTKNHNFRDETITVFDREIQFYIAYLNYIAKFKQTQLKFCYPKVSNNCKDVYNYKGFDLALANKFINNKLSIVVNDFYLNNKERILVVSGPNQGGKTTFARTFGQLHFLASIGCKVQGVKAQLFLFDKLFTHFEKEENIKNLHSKLEDDLVRIYSILSQATSNSIIIMNEILSSTTLQDAIFLSKKLMEKIIKLDLLSVWVTFIDELASFSEKTVSMVSTVNLKNPALRTFKIVRKPANGLAYAISIIEKHKLTYKNLKERLKL